MKHLIFLVLFGFLISCSRPTETNEVSDSVGDSITAENGWTIYPPPAVNRFSLVEAQTDTIPGDTSKIFTFEGRGAISIIPDTTWISQQQKVMGDDWNTIVDDNAYYDSDAWDTLSSIGVEPRYVDVNKKPFLKLKFINGRILFLDTKRMPGAWGYILFNGKDMPSLCPSIDVSNVMDSIFRK